MKDCLHIFLPLISLAINAVCQVFSFRYIIRVSLLKSIFLGFAFGLFSLLFGELSHLSQFPLKSADVYCIISNVIVYLALCNVYFHFLNMGETARRIRILRELAASKDGLSLDEILRRYNAEEIVERRLVRLMKNGQIILRDNKYYISGFPMLLIARFITALKVIIFGKRRGV